MTSDEFRRWLNAARQILIGPKTHTYETEGELAAIEARCGEDILIYETELVEFPPSEIAAILPCEAVRDFSDAVDAYGKAGPPDAFGPTLEMGLDAIFAVTEAERTHGWHKQSEVAEGLGCERWKVKRWIEQGLLRTNGQSGHACRVDPQSILEFCERTGIAWNDM